MFASLFSFPALLTIGGAVLLGYGTLRKSSKAALLTLAGFAAIVVSLPMHFVAASAVSSALTSLFFSTAVGMAIVGLAAGRKKDQSGSQRQFMILAIAALTIAIAFRLVAGMIGGSNVVSTVYSSDDVEDVAVQNQLSDADESILVELGPDDTIDEIMPLIDEFGGTVERAFPSVSLDSDED
ncbi:MAG: hypothetical protein HKN13_08240, partial [Rhodothermales bacterium]|nr:hypothetical protein [Rhodothermales bacterium]